jgi:hypothetical protein
MLSRCGSSPVHRLPSQQIQIGRFSRFPSCIRDRLLSVPCPVWPVPQFTFKSFRLAYRRRVVNSWRFTRLVWMVYHVFCFCPISRVVLGKLRPCTERSIFSGKCTKNGSSGHRLTYRDSLDSFINQPLKRVNQHALLANERVVNHRLNFLAR